MPPKKRKETVVVTVRPTTDFAKGNVMKTKVNGYKYEGRFRTKDIGDPGGMKATVGKLKSDVAKKGLGAETTTQRYILDKDDVKIQNRELIAKTTRGREEIKSIKSAHGQLEYVGGDYLIPKSKLKIFQQTEYSSNPDGGEYKRTKGIRIKQRNEARKKGVPSTIINKMVSGTNITNEEARVLHNYGYEYVPGHDKTIDKGKIEVRATLRKYIGNTERRTVALSHANSRNWGDKHPELLVPGYSPIRTNERKIRMPGKNI